MMSGDSRVLALEITYMRKVNWSLLRAGLPLVWRLTIRNCDSTPAGGLRARLSLPNYLNTGWFPLPEIQHHAMTLLAAIADHPRVSLDEWVSGTPEQQTQVVQAVFAALLDRYPKAYQHIEKFSLQARSQRIRFPNEAVSGATGTRHGA